mmetsp:Transcript_23730/g.54808  ORF Transcript_23730/g.54808 Transcript_23730/m.54808 type:complete len:207 (-) Transcript_23730:451-1071(-)
MHSETPCGASSPKMASAIAAAQRTLRDSGAAGPLAPPRLSGVHTGMLNSSSSNSCKRDKFSRTATEPSDRMALQATTLTPPSWCCNRDATFPLLSSPGLFATDNPLTAATAASRTSSRVSVRQSTTASKCSTPEVPMSAMAFKHNIRDLTTVNFVAIAPDCSPALPICAKATHAIPCTSGEASSSNFVTSPAYDCCFMDPRAAHAP